jgi:hypothetical protein
MAVVLAIVLSHILHRSPLTSHNDALSNSSSTSLDQTLNKSSPITNATTGAVQMVVLQAFQSLFTKRTYIHLISNIRIYNLIFCIRLRSPELSHVVDNQTEQTHLSYFHSS